ncbi:MAG TPA: hypothetical protein VMV41_09795 [Cellulomonadaceae bacterium]|nr:hypothetical protein [Cellulomonadaceae bacterium]
MAEVIDDQRASHARSEVNSKMRELVKGAGFNRAPSSRELPPSDVAAFADHAENALFKSVKQGIADPVGVTKAWNPAFASQFQMAIERSPMNMALQQMASQWSDAISQALEKNITLTSPLASGLVPFDLVAPSRLIYPVYAPLRNRLPRVPGMGTSHRAKVLTGISGSQTGGTSILDAAIPELITGSGSLNNWPLNLPPSGSQAASDLSIPYKFYGISESVSLLAQLAGQGFEDAAALANLILIQESLMAEEYQLLDASGTVAQTPGTPTLAARAAGASETALTGVSGSTVWVKVTGTNYFGETVASSGASVNVGTGGEVVDVTISAARGVAQYNLYVTTGTAAGTYYLAASGIGGVKYTLQGALPTSGATPPTADTGTGNTNRYEGLMSVLDGHAVTDASVYPSGYAAGYTNLKVGDTLNHKVVDAALLAMWDGSSGFRANPAEILCEGGDAVRFSQDIYTNTALNYRLFIDQGEVNQMRGGAAISEYTNPVTRSVLAITVHPWGHQGTAFINSYTLPHPYSNVANVMENVLVQDLIGIAWPVIDASFRFSTFWYGTLFVPAPQYCGILKGLQVSAATPYS